jgi:hemolysin activation/secretion protein
MKSLLIFLRLPCAILILLAISRSTVSSQDADRYLPRVRPSRTILPHVPLATLEVVEGHTDVLVQELKGIMILDHESQVMDPIKTFDGIRIHPAADLTVAREDSFRDSIRGYVGGPISLQQLNQMARSMVWAYRDMEQPVVDINIPPGQDITDGIIQMIITESTIGDVRFKGNCNFDSCNLEQQTWLCKGQRIFVPTLEQELVWFNRNPYRNVDVRLVPGTDAATTDIVFEVCDENPSSYYVGYSDDGPRVAGLQRLSAGFDYGNLFGKDHRLSYQYTTDVHLSGTVNVHSLNYEAPIFENRDTVSVFATWGDIDTVFDSPLGMRTASSGDYWQVSGRYHHTLCENECRFDQMHFGLDLKGADNYADFGVFPALNSGPQVNVVNFMAGISSE